MPKREVTATEITCDGCGKIQILTDDMYVIGLSGTAYEQNELGGWDAKWFACKRKCVAKAVLNALDRRDDT